MSKFPYDIQRYIVWNPFTTQFQYQLIFYNEPINKTTPRITCWCSLEKVNFVVKKRNMVISENIKDERFDDTILKIVNNEYKNIDTFVLNNLVIKDLQKNFIEYFI